MCHSTCKTCKGPLDNDCLSCIVGAVLHSAKSTCICSDAFKGFGIDTTVACTDPVNCFTCMPCVYPCRSCYKTDTQSCLTCVAGKFGYNYTCLDQCPVDIT
jgi:proprotein convertase subtilisin/kexin type 5